MDCAARPGWPLRMRTELRTDNFKSVLVLWLTGFDMAIALSTASQFNVGWVEVDSVRCTTR